jgi:hypothetical protein
MGITKRAGGGGGKKISKGSGTKYMCLSDGKLLEQSIGAAFDGCLHLYHFFRDNVVVRKKERATFDV